MEDAGGFGTVIRQVGRIRRAVTKHGKYSQAAKAEQRYFRTLLKECRETIGLIG